MVEFSDDLIYDFFYLVNKVRLVTLQMSIILLKKLVYNGHPGQAVLKDSHLALLEVINARNLFPNDYENFSLRLNS